jgi:hypothetical protein
MAKKSASGTEDSSKKSGGANIGYEAELWQMADATCDSMDADNKSVPFISLPIHVHARRELGCGYSEFL